MIIIIIGVFCCPRSDSLAYYLQNGAACWIAARRLVSEPLPAKRSRPVHILTRTCFVREFSVRKVATRYGMVLPLQKPCPAWPDWPAPLAESDRSGKSKVQMVILNMCTHIQGQLLGHDWFKQHCLTSSYVITWLHSPMWYGRVHVCTNSTHLSWYCLVWCYTPNSRS